MDAVAIPISDCTVTAPRFTRVTRAGMRLEFLNGAKSDSNRSFQPMSCKFMSVSCRFWACESHPAPNRISRENFGVVRANRQVHLV